MKFNLLLSRIARRCVLRRTRSVSKHKQNASNQGTDISPRYDVILAGCWGVAGDFGFPKGHKEKSYLRTNDVMWHSMTSFQVIDSPNSLVKGHRRQWMRANNPFRWKIERPNGVSHGVTGWMGQKWFLPKRGVGVFEMDLSFLRRVRLKFFQWRSLWSNTQKSK